MSEDCSAKSKESAVDLYAYSDNTLPQDARNSCEIKSRTPKAPPVLLPPPSDDEVPSCINSPKLAPNTRRAAPLHCCEERGRLKGGNWYKMAMTTIFKFQITPTRPGFTSLATR